MLGKSDENTIVNKKLNFPKHFFFQFYVILYKNFVLVAQSFRVLKWRSKSLCVSNLYSQSMDRCIPCSFHWGKEAVRQDWSHLQSGRRLYMYKSKFTKTFGYMFFLYELLSQFCFKKLQLFHVFFWKWRPRSLCVSRIYTANQWIDVYHAHFTGERKPYVKTLTSTKWLPPTY